MTEERKEELTEDLPEIARHTSERERRADDAERELVQWKKVRFMADKVGDEFEGYITGVSAFGLFIELVEHFVEGMVHVSTMADDYYRFVERAHILRGENTGTVYRLGDRVTVQVIKVDMERRQIDLGLTEILDARARVGAQPRPAPQQGASRSGRQRAAAGKRSKGRASRKRERAGPAGARAKRGSRDEHALHRHRHGRPHRSRQERAGARAHRHRSRPPEGRAGARHHHRSRVRARSSATASTSRSWTCRATSGSSRTCSPAPAASTW